jgi:hypothetical protein
MAGAAYFLSDVGRAFMVGRTPGGPPRSATDAHVGLPAPCKMLTSLFRKRDEGLRADQGVRPSARARLPSHHQIAKVTRWNTTSVRL